MARDTRKEARVARDIIKRRMMPLDIRATIKGYDITHADHFSCIIGDRKMEYRYSMGDIEVRRQGEVLWSCTSTSPELFRMVRPILKDLEGKIKAAVPLPHIATAGDIEHLADLASYANDDWTDFFVPNIVHGANFETTEYDIRLVNIVPGGGVDAKIEVRFPARLGGHLLRAGEVVSHALSFRSKTLSGYDPANPPDELERSCWLAALRYLTFIKENEILKLTGYDRIKKTMAEAGSDAIVNAAGEFTEYGDIARLTEEEQKQALRRIRVSVDPSSIPHVGTGSIEVSWMTVGDPKAASWSQLLERAGTGFFGRGTTFYFDKCEFITSCRGMARTFREATSVHLHSYLIFSALSSAVDAPPGRVLEHARQIAVGAASCMTRRLHDVMRQEVLLQIMRGTQGNEEDKKRLEMASAKMDKYEMGQAARKIAGVLAGLMKDLEDNLKDAETNTRGDSIPITLEEGTGWVFRFNSHNEKKNTLCQDASLVFMVDGRAHIGISLAKAASPAGIAKRLDVDSYVRNARRTGEPKYLVMLCEPEAFCEKMKSGFTGYVAQKLGEIENKKEEYYKAFRDDFPEDLMEIWAMGPG